MAHQQVFDIAAICASHGIKLAVICPGSRSAPILMGFTRHPEIKCYTITDERSAAFIALGLAQSSQNPVALICTSGTAAYNFAPAVAEAFFSHVPLLVITADRPPEWIDQLDGQTIRQENIYRSHVKSSYNFPADFNHADAIWHAQRMVNEAIIHSKALPQGPVHINVPLREPLYSAETSSFKYSEKLQVFKSNTAFPIIDDAELKSLAEQWHDYPHKLLVIGQLPHDKVLREAIVNFSQKHHLPVIADVISNQHGAPELISYQDLFLGQMPEARMQALRPDLLITIGQSLISKNLKLFLRKHKAQAHWHVQAHLPVADTFRQLTYIIQSSPVDALKKLTAINAENTFAQQQQNNYFNLWQLEQRHVQKIQDSFFELPELNELELVKEVLSGLPEGSNLHLANSMAVRYANFLGMPENKSNVKVWSNRGTSGIDGCNSTCVGHALNTDELQILITGDMAFFYDRNAFWHNYPLNNLRIILLNNHGSLIFGLLNGPDKLPEFKEYFETHQALEAKSLAAEFNLEYLKPENKAELKPLLARFFSKEGKGKIFEIVSSTSTNKHIFESLKQNIKASYES